MDPINDFTMLKENYENNFTIQANKLKVKQKPTSKVILSKTNKSYSYHSYSKSSLNINNTNTNTNTDFSNTNNMTSITQEPEIKLRMEIEEDREEDESPIAMQEEAPEPKEINQRQINNIEEFIKISLKVKQRTNTVYERSKKIRTMRTMNHIANKINKDVEEVKQFNDLKSRQIMSSGYFSNNEERNDNRILSTNMFEKGKEWKMKIDRKLQSKMLINNKNVLKECTFSPIVNTKVPELKLKPSKYVDVERIKSKTKSKNFSQSKPVKVKLSENTIALRKQFTNTCVGFMTRRESYMTFKENYNEDLKKSCCFQSQAKSPEFTKFQSSTHIHQENCFCCRIKNASKRIDNAVITDSSVQRNTLNSILEALKIPNLQAMKSEAEILFQSAQTLISENKILIRNLQQCRISEEESI